MIKLPKDYSNKVIRTRKLINSATWGDKLDSMMKSTTKSSDDTSLRYLESNSWSLKLGDINVFIDPVMSQLDFGIPFLYSGKTHITHKDIVLLLKLLLFPY